MAKHNEFLFATDATRFYFPWMCLLMVFIGTLLCGGGLMTYNSIQSWHQDVAKSLTVQIDTYDKKGGFRNQEISSDIEKALSILRTTPGVLGASVIDDNQMADLMAPWIGADINLDSLPLPKLIDVEIDVKNPPALEQLKSDLNSVVPYATMDSHRIWLADLIHLSHRIIQVVSFLLFLLIFTIVFTVAYTTRASLNVHESIISLVHMMGAKDIYITSKYASYNLKRAFLGGALGFIFAIPLLLLLMYCFKSTSQTIFQSNFSMNQWILLGCWPVFICLISFITTFKTVFSYLRRFL